MKNYNRLILAGASSILLINSIGCITRAHRQALVEDPNNRPRVIAQEVNVISTEAGDAPASAFVQPPNGIIAKNKSSSALAPKKGRRRGDPLIVRQNVQEEQDIFDLYDEKKYNEKNRQAVEALVKSGESFLRSNEMSTAFNAFTNDTKFISQDRYLFVFDDQGVCYAHGDDEQQIWKNLYGARDMYGVYYIRQMIDTAKTGGGWVTYGKQNATKLSYVKEVKKGEKWFLIGSGYYPHSKRDACVSLVKAAVAYFNEATKKGTPVSAAFGEFNYSLSRFRFGDLYLYALDFNGNIVVQGDRPGLVGQNSLEYKADGKFANKEIIEKLKKSDSAGVWIEYISKRARKITYAEKVVDAAGKSYFIACGFYPEADRKQVVELVRQGARYMELHGLSVASQEFTDKRSPTFRYGDLFLFVYDFKGKCLANGDNEELVGKNQFDDKDQDGAYYIRNMITKAQNGGGWVDFKDKNAYEFAYVEKVELGNDNYVIGSGIFPISKPETMQLLVRGAGGLLHDAPLSKAAGEFSNNDGKYVNGDLSIMMFDYKGICYADGRNNENIWKNMFNAKDDDGRLFIKELINTSKGGSGNYQYKMHGASRLAYVEPVDKDGKSFIVASSFAL